jgi:hypothetical protein
MKVEGTIWGKEEDNQEVGRRVFLIQVHNIDVWKGQTEQGTNGHCHCNLRYLGGWDKEDWIQASLGQKIQKQKMGNTCF